VSSHLCAFDAYDVLQQATSDATYEVSFDGGASFRMLKSDEKTTGIAVPNGQKFTARISKAGLFPVVQPLVIRDDDHLDYDGPRDFGASPLFSHTGNQTTPWRHMLHASLTLLRDGGVDRRAHGCPEVPPFTHDILSFTGVPVLSPAGTGFGRFAATLTPSAPSYSNGQLLFFKTVSGAKLDGAQARAPELTAVFVPKSIDLAAPVPMHIFFTPNTGTKTGDYPYGVGGGSFSEMTDNYLVSGGKRFLNQCNASGKKVVFVFPLGPREAQFGGILPATSLRRFLLELVYCIQRTAGGVRFRFEEPRLGVCSASAFSAGGETLVNLMQSSMGDEFPELREAYALDAFLGKTVDAHIRLASTFSAWWAGGTKGRRVRMYTHYGFVEDVEARPNFAKTIATRSGGAFSTDLPETTLAYAPVPFWQKVSNEEPLGSPFSSYLGKRPDDSSTHQLMPCIFLQHALKNSTHDNA